jgi:hypothetical protein
MANWKYNLGEDGKLLREYILAEQSAEIIEHLQKCYQFILGKLTSKDKEDYQYEIEEAYYLLEGEADIIRNEPEVITDEWEFDDVQSLVNSRLSEFYDICDRIRCWVAL